MHLLAKREHFVNICDHQLSIAHLIIIKLRQHDLRIHPVSGTGSDSEHFLDNFQKYNNCFQMTSFVASHIVQDNFMPTFKQDQSKTLTGRMYELPDFLGSITCSIGYITVTAERLSNLVTFKIPFFSFVAIAFLVASSAVLRVLSFNYIMMALGIYKYVRKHLLNPEREPNNDILDFISHVPANNTLKDWKELSVPEPIQSLDTPDTRTEARYTRSFSSNI